MFVVRGVHPREHSRSSLTPYPGAPLCESLYDLSMFVVRECVIPRGREGEGGERGERRRKREKGKKRGWVQNGESKWRHGQRRPRGPGCAPAGQERVGRLGQGRQIQHEDPSPRAGCCRDKSGVRAALRGHCKLGANAVAQLYTSEEHMQCCKGCVPRWTRARLCASTRARRV